MRMSMRMSMYTPLLPAMPTTIIIITLTLQVIQKSSKQQQQRANYPYSTSQL
jgi:hypothetical protein